MIVLTAGEVGSVVEGNVLNESFCMAWKKDMAVGKEARGSFSGG